MSIEELNKAMLGVEYLLEDMERVNCPHCGKPVLAGNFCNACGKKMVDVCDCWVLGKKYNCGEDKCPKDELWHKLHREGRL